MKGDKSVGCLCFDTDLVFSTEHSWSMSACICLWTSETSTHPVGLSFQRKPVSTWCVPVPPTHNLWPVQWGNIVIHYHWCIMQILFWRNFCVQSAMCMNRMTYYVHGMYIIYTWYVHSMHQFTLTLTCTLPHRDMVSTKFSISPNFMIFQPVPPSLGPAL